MNADVSRKYIQNCERRLFQRPDDAIHRGYDHQAESDIAEPDTFISNFQPLEKTDAVNLVEDVIGFSAYTEPMQNLISAAAGAPDDLVAPLLRFVGASAHRRWQTVEESALPATAAGCRQAARNCCGRTRDASVP